MKYTPRPYQKIIEDAILSRPRCAIWAGMGMGKTVATLSALASLIRRGEGPVLVLAPLRVAQSTWPDEAEKWDFMRGIRVTTLTGSEKTRSQHLRQIADIYCMNYENLPWLVQKLHPYWKFPIIVADEATRLKGFRKRQGSVRARALAQVQLQIMRLIELTGTPASNGLQDLWGQAWFLDSGQRLGRSMSAYLNRWFCPIRVGAQAFAVKWEPLPGSDEDIKEKLADLTTTLNAEDWFDLEKPIVTDIRIDLPPAARKAYAEMEKKMFLELDRGEVEAANAAVKTGKCLQIASGTVYRDDGSYEEIHAAKLDALESVIEEANGEPVLVAYQFRSDRERILKKFRQARALDKDPRTIRDWNAGKIPILLAHPASCGHGLSLQDGGRILCFYSAGWNMEEHEQIIERIGPTRQAQSGNKRAVFIYNLIAAKTMDEAVQKRLATKRDVLDLLLERRKGK